MKSIFQRFHHWLDNLASKLVGETNISETPPPDASESVKIARNTSSISNMEESSPTENPFESAPNVEELIPPKTDSVNPEQVESRTPKRAASKPSQDYKTKNTVVARKLGSSSDDHLVGMKKRKSGERPDEEKIVQNETNDTVYMQRNEIVKVVYDRYAKFGDKVASAVLSKTFLPNGLQIMLNKLELESVGSALADHDQVVDWIDEHGIEEFCARIKIRM